MKQVIEDIRIMSIKSLPSPREVKELYRLDPEIYRAIAGYRETVAKILSREDNHFLVIIGPCSIHNSDEAIEYATRLKKLSDEVSDKIFIVMRAFFAKPRTTVGWKGMMYDPRLDDSCDIAEGVRLSRCSCSSRGLRLPSDRLLRGGVSRNRGVGWSERRSLSISTGLRL